jgi:hypothetical protein
MLCAGTVFYTWLFKKRYKGWEDEEEDVSSYCIILREREDT